MSSLEDAMAAKQDELAAREKEKRANAPYKAMEATYGLGVRTKPPEELSLLEIDFLARLTAQDGEPWWVVRRGDCALFYEPFGLKARMKMVSELLYRDWKQLTLGAQGLRRHRDGARARRLELYSYETSHLHFYCDENGVWHSSVASHLVSPTYHSHAAAAMAEYLTGRP